MTPIQHLFSLFILAYVVAENSALEEINTALALKAAKDNPVLLKILETVDAATSNERLFDVTLKILKSLCICMGETLRTKQLESYQLNKAMELQQTRDDARVANKKVLDLYQIIYNKTCFDLREELAMKVNKSGDIIPEEENEFMEHSNCGKKSIEENTEDYEILTSQINQVAESETRLRKILHSTFVLTRDYHKFHMRKFNLFKNSQKSTQNSAKHSIIVILTFYPHHNGSYPEDNSTEVNSAELNSTPYSNSPIDIDVIDTRYGHKENNRDEDFIPKPATNCSLKSIYNFLLQSEQVNKTKIFKMLRKKGTIKVYIDIPTQMDHIDYSKVCCKNETEIPFCKIDFSRESFDTHEITTYLPEFKKRKKLHGGYKDTISKIKTLVKLYDQKINRNKLNKINFKAIEKNIKNKFNNIVSVRQKPAAEIDKDDKIVIGNISFKTPSRSKFSQVAESVAGNNYYTTQYMTEKHILPKKVSTDNIFTNDDILKSVNNEFDITEFETNVLRKIINTKAEDIAKDTSRGTTDCITKNCVGNANINTNTIDYSDFAKKLQITERYSKQSDYNYSLEQPSIVSKNNRISTSVQIAQEIKGDNDTKVGNTDVTSTIPTIRRTNTVNYEVTPNKLTEKVAEMPTPIIITENLPNLLFHSLINEEAPDLTFSNLKVIKTTKDFDVSTFENNTKKPKAEFISNMFGEHLKITTEPYSNHKQYAQNIGDTLVTSLKVTDNSDNDIKITNDFTTATSQLSTYSKRAHESADSLAIIRGFKSSQEFSQYSGDAVNYLKGDKNNAVITSGLSDQKELLPFLTSKDQSSVTHFSMDKFVNTLSNNTNPKLTKNGFIIAIREHGKSATTPKLNDNTRRPSGIVATNIIDNGKKELDISISDVEQYSSKINKSRINRSTSAIKKQINTYNQMSTFSTTVTFNEHLVNSSATSTLQDLDESNVTEALQLPETINKFNFPSNSTETVSPVTVDPSFDITQQEVVIIPRTEKYQSIFENDSKITTYIISPNVIKDTYIADSNLKQSLAELNNLTNSEPLNATKYDDSKVEYLEFIHEKSLNDQVFTENSHNFTAMEPQPMKHFIFSDVNDLNADGEVEKRIEIKNTAALRFTINSTENKTNVAKDNQTKIPYDVYMRVVETPNLSKNMSESQIRSISIDKAFEISLETKFEETQTQNLHLRTAVPSTINETQVFQSLQSIDISNSQNISKASRYEKTNDAQDLDAHSSQKIINNDFQMILNSLNESSFSNQQSSNTSHTITEAKKRDIDNLTTIQLQSGAWNHFTENISKNTKGKTHQEEDVNGSLKLTIKNTNNMNDPSRVTEVIYNPVMEFYINDKLAKISKQTSSKETQTSTFLTSTTPHKFYQLGYFKLPVKTSSSLIPFENTNTGNGDKYTEPITTENVNVDVFSFLQNKDNNTEHYFNYAKTSNISKENYFDDDDMTATRVLRDSDTTFGFTYKKFPFIDAVTSNFETKETISKSSKPDPTTKPKLDETQQIGFVTSEYNKSIDNIKLLGPIKDFTSFTIIKSLNSTKFNNDDEKHMPEVVGITNSDDLFDEANIVAVTVPSLLTIENNFELKITKTPVSNKKLQHMYNSRPRTEKEIPSTMSNSQYTNEGNEVRRTKISSNSIDYYTKLQDLNKTTSNYQSTVNHRSYKIKSEKRNKKIKLSSDFILDNMAENDKAKEPLIGLSIKKFNEPNMPNAFKQTKIVINKDNSYDVLDSNLRVTEEPSIDATQMDKIPQIAVVKLKENSNNFLVTELLRSSEVKRNDRAEIFNAFKTPNSLKQHTTTDLVRDKKCKLNSVRIKNENTYINNIVTSNYGKGDILAKTMNQVSTSKELITKDNNKTRALENNIDSLPDNYDNEIEITRESVNKIMSGKYPGFGQNTSPKNGTNLETLIQTPKYVQVTDTLKYNDGNFEDDEIISHIERTSTVTRQLQADVFNYLATTESLSDTREFNLSSYRVKRVNETYNMPKVSDIPIPSNITVGYVADNKLNETPSKELFTADFMKSKSKTALKPIIFSNYLDAGTGETTEEPSFDTVLMAKFNRAKSGKPSVNTSKLTTSSVSQIVFKNTNTFSSTENENYKNTIPSKDDKISNYSTSIFAAGAYNSMITKPYYLEFQNETQYTIPKPILRDQDAYTNDKLRKMKVTAALNKIAASNYVTFSNLSRNENLYIPTKSDLSTNLFESQSQSQSTQEIINFDTRLDMVDIPLEIKTDSNFNETQTEVMTKSLRSDEGDSLGHFTHNTTSHEIEMLIDDTKTKFYKDKAFMDEAHNLTEIQSMGETKSSDMHQNFDDQLRNMKESIKIHETINNMSENEIHKALPNWSFTTFLDETIMHEVPKYAHVIKSFDDRPNITQSYIKITTKPIFDRPQTEKYQSAILITESSNTTESSKSLESTIFTERDLFFSNAIISLTEDEHAKKTLNIAETSSFLHSNNSDKVSYAITESLPDSMNHYYVSNKTILHTNDKIMFKKRNTENNNIVTSSDTSVYNLDENKTYNTLSKTLHVTEFGGSDILRELQPDKGYDNINTRFDIIDLDLTVTEKPNSHETQKEVTFPAKTYDMYEYSPYLTISTNVDTVNDINGLERTSIKNTDFSKNRSNELRSAKTIATSVQSYRFPNSVEYNTDAQNESNKISKDRIGLLNYTFEIANVDPETNNFVTTSNIETGTVLNLSSKFDIGPGITEKVTEFSVLRNEMTVDTLNNLLQNKTELVTLNETQNSDLIFDHFSSTERDINSLNFVTEWDGSKHFDEKLKANTTISNNADAWVDTKVVKESNDFITNKFTLIETATASYNHFMSDLTFHDTTKNGHKITDEKISSENQTRFDAQFTINNDRNSKHTDIDKMKNHHTTTVSEFEVELLEKHKTKEINSHLEIITDFEISETPQFKKYDSHNYFESTTDIDQQHITTTSESPSTEKNERSPQSNDTIDIISLPTEANPSKKYQYESANIVVTDKISNIMGINQTSSVSDYIDNSYSTNDTNITSEVHVVDETNVTSRSTVSNVKLDGDFVLMNKSTTNIKEKKISNVFEAETATKLEKKDEFDKMMNLNLTATEKANLKTNLGTTISNSRILELLGKIRSSYKSHKEFDDVNDLELITGKYYLTGTTQIREMKPSLADTKILHKIEPTNVFDGSNIVRPTEQGHNAVTDIDVINHLQSEKSKNLNLKEKDNCNDTNINTKESNIQFPTYITLPNIGTNFNDEPQTELEYHTHPVSVNKSSTAYADYFDKFKETIELTQSLINNTSNIEYSKFDQTRTEVNSSNNNIETTNSLLESSTEQNTYISKTEILSTLLNETSSHNKDTPSDFHEEKYSLIDLHTVSPHRSNESKITERNENTREKEGTQLLQKYTDHNRERQLQSSGNIDELVTDVESNLLTFEPRTTSQKFSIEEIFTIDDSKTTAGPENTEKYFVTSPTTALFVKGNLTVPSNLEILEDKDGLQNQNQVHIATNRVDSFSTLSMTDENRNAPMSFDSIKPNKVDELTSPHEKKSAVDRSVLLHVPPLAFHITDLKFELLPTYNNNKTPQIVPNLHGKFNISLNMNPKHENDPMVDNIKTVEVLNKAKDFENLKKVGANSIFGSYFVTPILDLNNNYEKTHDKMTKHNVPPVKNEKEISSTIISDNIKALEGLSTKNAFGDQLYSTKSRANSSFKSYFEKPELKMKNYNENAHGQMTEKTLISNLTTNVMEFLSTKINDTSESQTIKYFLPNNNTHWDDSKNMSIKRRDESEEFNTLEKEEHANVDLYTAADFEQQGNTSLLLHLNTNLTSQLRTSSQSPYEDSVTDSYTFDRNSNNTNILEDTYKLHNTSLSNSTIYAQHDYNGIFSDNMITHKSYRFNSKNNKTSTINLTISTETSTTFEAMETELRNNVNQTFHSERQVEEPENNIIPSPSKDVAEITKNKSMNNNTSDHLGMIENNTLEPLRMFENDINISKIESDLSETNINTNTKTIYAANEFLNLTGEIDGNKTSNKFVPLISEPIRTITTTEITVNGNLLELAMSNTTNVLNPVDNKKRYRETTSNTSQLSEANPCTLTPIVLNIVMIVNNLNKKNSNHKSRIKNENTVPNKTVFFLEETTTVKNHTLDIQDASLKETLSNINKSKNLHSITKARGAISLLQINTKRNTDRDITNQKTSTLTTVSVMHTPSSQTHRKKDTNIAEVSKQQNRKSNLVESVNVNKKSNIENKVTVSGTMVRTHISNQQVHVKSRSWFKTTKQIKYNTYRPLTDEELDPSEIGKIISSFPKYYTKKVKTKNPQQVKNYRETSYGNKRKFITNQNVHNKSFIYDPLDKNNLYPSKKLITPRKVIKRLKLANKRNDIITMNTKDFFYRRLGVTQKDKISDVLKLYPKPVLKLQPVTIKPRRVFLRPKFNSFDTLTKKPSIKKPVIVQNMDMDYYRGLNPPHHRRSGPIWRNVINNIPGNPEVPLRIGFGDPVIEKPYYIPTVMKPKFLRDRVDSIRSYIYNAEKKPNYRRHFLKEPDDVDEGDDSFVQYSKGNSRDNEDTDMPLHRFTRPKKTIFFLSPTVPYNRYF